jgi:hypothetical protein
MSRKKSQETRELSSFIKSWRQIMEKEVIFLIEEVPEGGFIARALDHAIFTEADSLDELRSMIREAVGCHFEEAERPSIIRLHFVKDEVIHA